MEANNVIYAFATRGSVLTELEVLSDALANDAVLIRITMHGDHTAEVPVDIYSAKELSKQIANNQLVAMDEFRRMTYEYETGSQLTDPVPAYSYSSKDGSELKIYRVARHWIIEVTSTEFRIQIPATCSELNRVGLALNFGVNAWANKFSPPSA